MENSFKDAFKELLTDLFNTHPSVDNLFLTCDGQAFFQQAHADGHASRLPYKVVEEIERYAHFAETVVHAIEPVEPVTVPVEPVTEPVEPVGTATAEPESKLQIALDTPEADRTPAQKTLITKAAKAAQNKEGN